MRARRRLIEISAVLIAVLIAVFAARVLLMKNPSEALTGDSNAGSGDAGGQRVVSPRDAGERRFRRDASTSPGEEAAPDRTLHLRVVAPDGSVVEDATCYRTDVRCEGTPTIRGARDGTLLIPARAGDVHRCELFVTAPGFTGARVEWVPAQYPLHAVSVVLPRKVAVQGHCIDEQGSAIGSFWMYSEADSSVLEDGTQVAPLSGGAFSSEMIEGGAVDGYFEAEIGVSSRTVFILADEYAPMPVEVRWPIEDTADFGTIVLRPGGRIGGTVVDGHDRPSNFALVVVAPRAGKSWLRVKMADDRGRFEVRGLPESGTLRLFIVSHNPAMLLSGEPFRVAPGDLGLRIRRKDSD